MMSITALSALKAHILKKYLKTSIVHFALQDAQAASITPHVPNAIIQAIGGRTVRTTVSIALATVIEVTVAGQGALMNIIKAIMYQKVAMIATRVLHRALLVQICYIVRNAGTVSTAKQTLHVQNVPQIVEMNRIAINRMDLV